MTTEPIAHQPRRKVKNFALLSNRAGAAFLSPAGLLVSVFVIVPFFWVIFVSFTNNKYTLSVPINISDFKLRRFTRPSA